MSRHWCPYHSSLANPRLFPASHPCLTVYDPAPTDQRHDDEGARADG
jgi:hypothetical protein